MSSHELSVLKQRVASTAHAHLHADIAALRAQVTDLAAAISEQERTKVEAAARAKELEAKVKDIKGHRERFVDTEIYFTHGAFPGFDVMSAFA